MLDDMYDMCDMYDVYEKQENRSGGKGGDIPRMRYWMIFIMCTAALKLSKQQVCVAKKMMTRMTNTSTVLTAQHRPPLVISIVLFRVWV